MQTQSLFFGPLLYFRSVPALDRLSSDLLGAIAQHAEEEFFPAGKALLHPGQPREAFFIIVEGKVSVRDPVGREELLGPGDAVGFLHLLARSEVGLEATALWDTVALRVDWDAHLDACERHFPILEVHMSYLANRCQEETRRIRRVSVGADSPLHPPPMGFDPKAARPDETLPSSPMNLVQRLTVLHRSRAFPSAGMDALAEMSRHVEEVHFSSGEDAWKEGDPSESILLVASGRLVLEGPGGIWREVVDPGRTAGRFEALADLPREGSLRADAPSRTLRIGIEALLDILEDHFTMAVDFTAGLAQELINLQESSPREVENLDLL